MSVYNFPSIIYTTYATSAPSSEIIEFAIQHDNIKVIKAHYGDVWRFDGGAINTIHDNGLLLYTHTLNSYEQLVSESARGVDGLYTDLLLPRDIEIYDKIEN